MLFNKALKLNNKVLDNRYLEISMAEGRKLFDKQKSLEEKKASITPETLTVFVKNLPYDATADEIGDFFRDCGKIRDVRLVYNSVNNNFKGFAYIEFLKHTSLYSAIKKNATTFKGRPIVVDVDSKRPRVGYRYVESENNTKYTSG